MSLQGSKKATRVAMAAMIAMAAATTAAQAQELLLNNDFESGTIAGPTGFGANNWTTYNNGYTSSEYARETAGRSFKAYAPYSQYAGSVGIQNVAGTAGTSYTLSGYMFSPTADFIASPTDFGLLQLTFQDAAGNATAAAIGAKFDSTSTPDTWIPYTLTGVAPAGTVNLNVVIGYIQITTAPVGAVYWDDLSLKAVVAPSESNWIATGSGGWLSASNWQSSVVPNAVDAVANFNTSITAPTTVTIAGAGVTAGKVTFNDAANAYTVGGTGNLTLDVTTGSVAVNVTAGSHTINAPVIMNDSTVATVASGQSLTLGGALTLANGSKLSAAGAGTLHITSTAITGSAGASIHSAGGIVQADVDLGNGVDVSADTGSINFGASQHIRSLSVAAGAKASLTDLATAHIIRTPAITVATNGTLDLGDNAAIIDYTGTSPAATIRTGIVAGKAGGFAGTGITSTKAAADARYSIGYVEDSQIGSPTTFLGETGIDNTSLLLRVTLKGDADLSGTVDFNDLVSLAQNYGTGSGKVWRDGDNNYDGVVDFNDLVSLAQNYGTSVAALEAAGLSSSFIADWKLATSLVPEPTTLAGLMGASTLVLRRRRATV